jgi:SAM-dependent methyltransferase
MLRRHPWETARLAFFGRVLRWAGTLRTGARVLDVGAGDAWFASAVAALPERPSVVAWDVAYQRGQRPPAAGAVELADRAPTEAFDVVMLMDVLEHVDDDVGFLSEIVRRNVAAGGAVLLSVPAWPQLFGSHDERLGHKRRYTPSGARELVHRAGLDVRVAGGLFHALLPIRAISNAVERRSGRAPPLAGEWNGSGPTTAILDWLMSLEGRVSLSLARRGVDLPGLSWWALCATRAR